MQGTREEYIDAAGQQQIVDIRHTRPADIHDNDVMKENLILLQKLGFDGDCRLLFMAHALIYLN